MLVQTLRIRRRAAIQFAAVLLLVPICLLAARPFLEALDWGQVRLAWHKIEIWQWVLAMGTTAGSFIALGRYDVIVHRHLETGADSEAAQRSGIAAVALSQTLGMGLVTGTIVRWRALPSLTLIQAASVTAIVAISFIAAWLVLFSLAGLLVPGALPLPTYVFVASLFSACCFILYTVLKRHITVQNTRVRLPSLRAIRSLIFYAALDTGLAAVTFWILLPLGTDISLATVIPIYLTCLGISLVSNTPGGVGPFEVTLLWALHGTDVNGLMASVIAFRVVYFALPACVGMTLLIRPLRIPPRPKRPRSAHWDDLHAESGVIRQGGAILTQGTQAIAGLVRTSQASIALFEPRGGLDACWPVLSNAAKESATAALIYKCHARTALAAREQGLSVARIARDAIVNLDTLTLDIPARRSLRRKLRKVVAMDVTVHEARLDEALTQELEKIDSEWRADHDGARGFSMGRFTADYASRQRIFVAYKDDHPIAFITCHATQDDWALDIMRHISDVPDGVMHALVWAAMVRGNKAGAHRFSLASVPCREAPLLQAIERLSFRRKAPRTGLAQFKKCFAPHWVPLYAVAKSPAALCLSLWDVWQEVQDPPPLRSEEDIVSPSSTL